MKISGKSLFLWLGAILLLAGCGSGTPAVGWSPPVSMQGVVYISSGGGKVYALDSATGNKKWQFPADTSKIAASGSALYAAPVVGGQFVFAAGSDRNLYVLNAADGTKVCQFDTGDAIIATPAYSDGLVYVGSTDVAPNLLSNPDITLIPQLFSPSPSKLFAIDPSQHDDKGQCRKRWEFATGNKIWASPLIAGSRVYVASLDHHLYALDKQTGAKVWDFEAGGAIGSSPQFNEGLIYFGSFDTKVYAVNADSGSQAWQFTTGNWVWADPLVASNLVVIGSLDQNVYALDAKTGKQQWVFNNNNTLGGVRAGAAGGQGIVYVGSEDQYLYALNMTDGSKVWAQNTGGQVLAAPAWVDGSVVVQNSNHQVLAYDAASGQSKWEFLTDK